MNVLGVIFDTKLQWHARVQSAITKSKKALNAITLIRKYFSKAQLLNIITACYFSILYYNSEIWHLPQISPAIKQKLLSASAAPLKLTTTNYHQMISYNLLHYLNKRATPDQMTKYKHALLLHKTYNDESMSKNWTNLFLTNNSIQENSLFALSTHLITKLALTSRQTDLKSLMAKSPFNG